MENLYMKSKKTEKDKNIKKLSEREHKIQEIKKKLLQQREELLTEAEDARNVLPEEGVFPELGDQASADIDKGFMLRLKGRERLLLKKIDEAIDKIENGTYGTCENCGETISTKRLEARPVTTLCIECKTEQEAEEKLREH
jgi:DnaK suppressor protein